MPRMGQSTVDFWTDEQWRCLEPLTERQRFDLMVRATFSGKGLLSQARSEGYSDTAGWPNGQAPGSHSRSGDSAE